MTWWHGLLAVQAVTGLVWAFAAFRILFRLRTRAVQDSGQMFPGLRATLRTFAGFLTRPDDAPDRRRLGLLTLAMIALSILIAATGGAAQ
jgi:hypothetical protein